MQARIAAILGTGDAGYGQIVKSIPLVKPGSGLLTIRATEINDLRADLLKVLYHQEGSTYNTLLVPAAIVSTPGTTPSEVNVPNNGLFTKYESALTQIETNKWKLSSDSSQSTTSTGVVSVRNTDWNSEIYHEARSAFSSETSAKHFFNAGGELIVSIAMTGGTGTKSTTWATLLNSIGTITMNHGFTTVGSGVSPTIYNVGYYNLTSAYTLVFTKQCATPYENNTYSLYAYKQGQHVYLKLVLTDAAVIAGSPDLVVNGTITSTVKSRGATGTKVSLPQPTLTTTTELSASTGLTAGYAVLLTPATLAEGSDLTIKITAYQGLSTVWYKVVGDGTGIQSADFNDGIIIESKSINPSGDTTFTKTVAHDLISDSCNVTVELYNSDPSIPGAILLTTSNSIILSDSAFSLSLVLTTPVSPTLDESSNKTALFTVTGSSLPLSAAATWTATGAGASNLTKTTDNFTIGGSTATFSVTVDPNYKTTGDQTVNVKVTVGGVDSNTVSFTITDTSKPTVAYSSPKDSTGATAFTYTNPTYTITGGKPDGTYTFTRDSVVSASLQLDSNGSTVAIPFDGLSSPGDLVTKVTFSDTNEEISHTTTFSNDVQVLSVANPLDILDITYGKTLKINIELTKCYSPTTIEWELLSSPTGIGDSTNSTAQSGEIVTSGNGGIGNGTITLASALNSTRGSTFKVKFSLKSNALLTVSTDDIRIIDAFPYYTTSTTPVHVYLPTAATRTTIEASGGGGGGAGANSFTNGSNSGTVANGKGGSGGSAATIVSTHDILTPELVVTRGLAGKGGKSRLSTAGAAISGDGGAGGYSGGAGGAGGGGTAGSGAGGGGGGASTVTVSTTTFLIAGGAGGGGGGSNQSPGGDGASTAGLTTTMPKTAGGAGATNAGSGVSGGGGGGGNGGLGGNYGQDSVYGNTDATGGTAGSLSYHDGTKVGLPVLLYKYSAGGIGALNLSNQDGTTGVDGEVIIYVQPMAPQYPVAALQSGSSDIYYVTADAPIKDGSAQVLGYTITSSNTPLNGSSELTNTQLPVDDGTFTFTTGTRVSFEITADNQFGHGLIAKIPVQTSKVTDATKTGSKFGTSVAMSGDGTRMVVGSPDADGKGAVYVYRKFNNNWDLETTAPLADANGVSGDRFGYSVDITDDGSRIIVGSPNKAFTVNNVAYPKTGAAFIFKRATGTNSWTQEVLLESGNSDNDLSPIDKPNDYFGSSVKISGDGTMVFIGAYGDDTGSTYSIGYIWHYYINSTTNSWAGVSGTTGSNYLPTSAKEAQALHGYSLALSNNSLACAEGAPGDNNKGWFTTSATNLGNAGTVCLFKRTSTSAKTWSPLKTYIYSPTPIADGRFGASVALNADGTILVVGAPGESAFGLVKAGVVHIFAGSGTTWNIQAMLVASDTSTNANFGTSVSINDAGDTILVGAINASAGNRAGSGIVYQFVKTGTTWNQTLVITPYDKAAGDSFGTSVSMNTAGDLAVIGAPNSTASGAAYTFQI